MLISNQYILEILLPAMVAKLERFADPMEAIEYFAGIMGLSGKPLTPLAYLIIAKQFKLLEEEVNHE